MFAQLVLSRKTTLTAFCLFASMFVSPAFSRAQPETKDNADASVQDATLIHRQYKPVAGQPHLDFILPSIDGDKNIQLSDFRGKKVLLLHFASW